MNNIPANIIEIYGSSMNNIPANIIKITLYLARFKTEIQYTYFQLSNTMII